MIRNRLRSRTCLKRCGPWSSGASRRIRPWRYQSSADLRVELKGLLEMTGAGREEATVHLLSDHQEQTTHQLGAQASPSSVTGSDTVSRVAGAPPGQGPSPTKGPSRRLG